MDAANGGKRNAEATTATLGEMAREQQWTSVDLTRTCRVRAANDDEEKKRTVRVPDDVVENRRHGYAASLDRQMSLIMWELATAVNAIKCGRNDASPN